MKSESTSAESANENFPWYFLWVLGALLLAALSVSDFILTKNPGSALVSFAWLCWAFSWYAKPFCVRFSARPAEAISVQPLRPWVPQSLWNLVTFGALALLLAGLLVKFANAA